MVTRNQKQVICSKTVKCCIVMDSHGEQTKANILLLSPDCNILICLLHTSVTVLFCTHHPPMLAHPRAFRWTLSACSISHQRKRQVCEERHEEKRQQRQDGGVEQGPADTKTQADRQTEKFLMDQLFYKNSFAQYKKETNRLHAALELHVWDPWWNANFLRGDLAIHSSFDLDHVTVSLSTFLLNQPEEDNPIAKGSTKLIGNK